MDRLLLKTNTRPPARRDPRSGMTLIELLALAAIMSSLASLVLPRYQRHTDDARVAEAIGDLRALEVRLDGRDSLPDNLNSLGVRTVDPWGSPYVYVKFPRGAPRLDRFGVRLNRTYDLYSVGRDRATSTSLAAPASFDDVVRANDGGFLGQGSKF